MTETTDLVERASKAFAAFRGLGRDIVDEMIAEITTLRLALAQATRPCSKSDLEKRLRARATELRANHPDYEPAEDDARLYDEAATALAQAEARWSEETAIVDRIWNMLGRPPFEELRGRSIYDLVDELKDEIPRLQTKLAQAEAVVNDAKQQILNLVADNLCEARRAAQAEAGNKVGWRMLADVEPPDGEIILASDGNRRWQDIGSPHGVKDFYFSHRRHVATMWHPIAPLPDNAAPSASPRDGLEDRPTACQHDWRASELDGWICSKCGAGK